MDLAWNLTERERLTLRRNWGGGIGAAGMLLVFYFRFERESAQNGVFSLYSFLGEETRKAITRLKGFGSL